MEPRKVAPMPKMVKIGHHSVSDWDFWGASWTLDTGIYISSPSSLKFTSNQNCTNLKHAVSGQVREGRIVTNERHYRGRDANYLNYTFIFRQPHADGGFDNLNFYYVNLNGSTSANDLNLDQASCRRAVGGAHTNLGTKAIVPTLPQNTWAKLRLTWWESSGVLIVRLEFWNGAEWVSLCSDWTDPNNQFKDNAIQRIGVGTTSTNSSYATWHDDTEIWKKA